MTSRGLEVMFEDKVSTLVKFKVSKEE